MWIICRKGRGTVSLWEVVPELANSPYNENLIVHNLKGKLLIHIGGHFGPIEMCAQSSMTAFELKGRQRKLCFEIPEDELTIAIESIWPEQVIPDPISEIDPNIQRAMVDGEPLFVTPEDKIKLLEEVIFLSIQIVKNGQTKKENMISLTILNYMGNIIISNIITPRNYVKMNPEQSGIHEDQLVSKLDEFEAKFQIQQIVRDKIIVAHNLTRILVVAEIPTKIIKGYIDLSLLPVLVHQQKTNLKTITIKKITEVLQIKPSEYISNLKSEEEARILFQTWNSLAYEFMFTQNLSPFVNKRFSTVQSNAVMTITEEINVTNNSGDIEEIFNVGEEFDEFLQEIEIMDLTEETSDNDVIITREELPNLSRKNLFEEFQELIPVNSPTRKVNYQYQHLETTDVRVVTPSVDIDIWPKFVYNHKEITRFTKLKEDKVHKVVLNGKKSYQVKAWFLQDDNSQMICVCRDSNNPKKGRNVGVLFKK